MNFIPFWRRLLLYRISVLCRMAGVPDPTKPTLRITMIIPIGQQSKLTVKGISVDGKEVRLDHLDGVPTWVSSNEAVATVHPDEDGISAYVRGISLGTVEVTTTADADLDPGETRHLVKTTLHEVVAVAEAEADTLEITEGQPEPVPVA